MRLVCDVEWFVDYRPEDSRPMGGTTITESQNNESI
jgi:hypothetical protein